jgi:L-lactate dehydrogenase complex protein LldG
MSSRESILAAVRANRPEAKPLPTVPMFEGDSSVTQFRNVLENIGGKVVRVPHDKSLDDAILELFPITYRIASNLIKPSIEIDATTPILTLETVDLAVVKGEIGVAENGTIWVPAANMLHRALPMITQHLVIVLDEQNIVPTMHQAYAHVGNTGDYGVFIAGPSKTADIEQSLVIGAHGARSMTALLVG